MIVIDSSALISIFLNEPERQMFIDVIGSNPERIMSAANLLEARIVLLSRAGERGIEVFDRFLQEANIVIVPVDAMTSDIAFRAFRQYGKGRGHPAQLNFGDCFAYALAKREGVPLLFKGRDFIHTDIESAAVL